HSRDQHSLPTRRSSDLEKMTKIDPDQRYHSFTEIENDISAGIFGEIDFTSQQKSIYRKFAEELTNHISHYSEEYSPINNIPQTLDRKITRLNSSHVSIS